MNHYLSIIDEDYIYASKLAEYLNIKEGFPFLSRVIKADGVLDENVINESDLLLIGEGVFKSIDNIIAYDKIFVLYDGNTKKQENIKYISKYTNVEYIIKDIIFYSSEIKNLSLYISRKTPLTILSFYSPIKRCGQTAFSINLGTELAQSYRTLYVGMGSYSGLETLIEKKINNGIDEFIYNLDCKRDNLGNKLATIVENYKNLDILAPMSGQDDFSDIEGRKWIDMLMAIEKYTDYRYVILDLSDSIRNINGLLDISNKILTMELTDMSSQAKLSEYYEYLERQGKTAILSQTIHIDMSDKNIQINEIIKKIFKD